MIQLREIHKSYGQGRNRFEALKGISLSFRNNEFAAILGPSGSGKTTLLNVIGGLDHYDEGDLIIDQISTKNYSDRDWDSYRNHSIGFIFQNYNLIPHQSILANVEIALTISGVSPAERRERAMQALEKVGLGSQMNKLPSQLSGGQMQRVAIARALVNNPSVILADEPTGALDSKTSRQVMDLIREVAKDHLVIMVTHNAELADQYATRIITLKDGVIIDDSNPYEPAEHTEELSTQNMGRSSMKLSTAFSLSFHNLWSKRKRTILTAFAGSIGIIGIALILSLSKGVNQYIYAQESNMANAYPLLVDTVSLDLSSALSDFEMLSSTVPESDHVGVIPFVDRIRSMLGTNDLSALKKYLDQPEHDISDKGTVEYLYAVEPQIYLEKGDSVRCVCPDATLDAAGIPLSSINTPMFSSQISTTMFSCMPEHENLYRDTYEVKAGHWPKDETECVLVLTGDGRIVDYLLYVLGIRDSSELDGMIQSILQGTYTGTETTEEQNYEYSDFLGVTFKVVNSADCYLLNEEYGLWLDERNNEAFLKELVSKGTPLRIAGVVQPKNSLGTGCLKIGISYPHSLQEKMIAEAANSEVVRAQMSSPDVNILTGMPFDNTGSVKDLDIASMVSIDTKALMEAVALNEEALLDCFIKGSGLDSPDLALDWTSLASAINMDQLSTFARDMAGDYLSWLREMDYLNYSMYLEKVGEYFSSMRFRSTLARWMNKKRDDSLTVDALLGEMDELSSAVTLGLETYLADNGLQTLPISETTFAEYLESEHFQSFLKSFEDSLVDENGVKAESFIQQIIGILSDQLGPQLFEAIENGVRAVMEQGMQHISIDQEAFMNAFSLNIKPAELADILLSMTSLGGVSYHSNLLKMGYADKAHPSSIQIYTSDYAKKDAVIEELDRYNSEMEAAGRSGDTVTYTDTLGTVVGMAMKTVDIITAVLVAAVTVSLVVASIMIGVITYISVLERRKEIGILRAMGASRRNISQVFNAETSLTGLLAGSLGIVLSYLLLLPLNAFIHARTQINDISAFLPVEYAVLLIVIGAVLTTAGGLLPAHGASKSDPVEALRSE